MYVTTFAVEGSGHFPVDMLRYDQCWPKNTEDAVNLTEPRERRVVSLQVCHKQMKRTGITEGRWNSFGWSVNCVGDPVKVS